MATLTPLGAFRLADEVRRVSSMALWVAESNPKGAQDESIELAAELFAMSLPTPPAQPPPPGTRRVKR